MVMGPPDPNEREHTGIPCQNCGQPFGMEYPEPCDYNYEMCLPGEDCNCCEVCRDLCAEDV